MTRHQRHIFWLLFPLLCLLTVGVSAAITYWRHTVPLAETSEVYRQYRHLPGVRAAFIRQMPINDTLRLDMTLLEAEDSAAFADLLIKMGKSEEFVTDIMEGVTDPNVRYTGDCLRGEPGCPGDDDDSKNEVISFFPVRKAVAIFHTQTVDELHAVLDKSYFNSLQIKH